MENNEKNYFENSAMKMETEINGAIDELERFMSSGSEAMPLGVLMWFTMLPELKKRLGEELFYMDLNALDDTKENAISLLEELRDKFISVEPSVSFDDAIQRLKAAE